jgi:hypothetical protein
MISSEKSGISCKTGAARHLPGKPDNGLPATCAVLILFMIFLLPNPGDASATGRFWSYFNLTSLISPEWAVVTMPGLRYEFARNDDPNMLPAKGVYFYEFFVGPVLTTSSNAFTLKLPLWFYYMGFPTDDVYFYSHNIEFLPILSYRLHRTTFTSRTIFHNTVYASVYETPEMRSGYSLVVRQLLQIAYKIDERATIILADEPFFGIIEDAEAPPSPIGFWPSGFRLNRVYAGLQYGITPRITISPQYVFETAHDEGAVTDVNHYLFVTIQYVLKFF